MANRADTVYCRACGDKLAPIGQYSEPTGANDQPMGQADLPGAGWTREPIWNSGAFWAMDNVGNLWRITPRPWRVRKYQTNLGEVAGSGVMPLGIATFERPKWELDDSLKRAVHGPTLLSASERAIWSMSLAAAPLADEILPRLDARMHLELQGGHSFQLQLGGCGEFSRICWGAHALAGVVRTESAHGLRLIGIGLPRRATMTVALETETCVVGPAAGGACFAAPGETGLWVAISSPSTPLLFCERIPYPRNFRPFLSATDLAREAYVRLQNGSLPVAVGGPQAVFRAGQSASAVVHVLGLSRNRPSVWSVAWGGKARRESGQPYELAENAAVCVAGDGSLMVHQEASVMCFRGRLEPERIPLAGRFLRLGMSLDRAGDWVAGFCQEAEDTVSVFHIRNRELRYSLELPLRGLRARDFVGLQLRGSALLLSYQNVNPHQMGVVCWDMS